MCIVTIVRQRVVTVVVVMLREGMLRVVNRDAYCRNTEKDYAGCCKADCCCDAVILGYNILNVVAP